jgi:hypothetical protein
MREAVGATAIDRKFCHLWGSRRLKIEPGDQPILLVFQAGCLGMISVRLPFHRRNKSVREIARLTSLSRDTTSKYLNMVVQEGRC